MIGLPVVWIVHGLFWLYYLVLLVRVIFSFLRTPSYTSPWSPLWSFVYAATEPLLAPIRRLLRPYQARSGWDFSVLVLVLLLQVAETLIIRFAVH